MGPPKTVFPVFLFILRILSADVVRMVGVFY